MVQLILDLDNTPINLPESRDGGYTVTETSLSVEVEMISGRTVKEIRGTIWEISYQYGYFSPAVMQSILEVCRRGVSTPLHCAFIAQDGEMHESDFWVEYDRPKFMWSRQDNGNLVPLWGDFRLRLKEVEPHD